VTPGINTKGRYEFHGGRVEMRAKLPLGRGVWPDIWTLGANIGEIGHPQCGEIDLMEFVGYEPDFIYGSVYTYDYTIGKLKAVVEKAPSPGRRIFMCMLRIYRLSKTDGVFLAYQS
jgi:hypothetical protein